MIAVLWFRMDGSLDEITVPTLKLAERVVEKLEAMPGTYYAEIVE